jgi:HPt (histidine-containing phosphotransfer) domain-containing protein/two-component sensor histidine kinase
MNNDLQLRAAVESLNASQVLMSELERSKLHSDDIIDNLNNGFAIVDSDGIILKSNKVFASFLNINMERVVGHSVTEMFSESAIKIFESKMRQLSMSDDTSLISDFELSICEENIQKKNIVWSIRLMDLTGNPDEYCFQILAHDVTLLKEYETNISEILSSLPIGILSIGKKAEITGLYSPFVEHLLDTKDLKEQTIYDVLFDRCESSMSANEIAGAKQIESSIGDDDFWFDSAKSIFPKEVKLMCGNSEGHDHRWIGLSYYAILQDGKIEKILLVLEDRTSLVHSRNAQEIKTEFETHEEVLFTQIKNCDNELLVSTISEFSSYLKRINELLDKETEITFFAQSLHGIKGLARTAGFIELQAKVHTTEARLQKKQADSDHAERIWLTRNIAPIEMQINLISILAKALIGQTLTEVPERSTLMEKYIEIVEHKLVPLASEGAAYAERSHKLALTKIKKELRIHSPFFVKLDEYTSTLEARVAQTATSLGKDYNLEIDWAQSRIHEDDLASFGEIALHLLTNTLDHAIESKADRLKAKKPKVGKITISAKENSNGSINIKFSDDGRGISVVDVVKSAIKKGLITAVQAKKLSTQEKLRLITRPGFSTTEEVSVVSGRGIGMAAVVEAITRLNGSKPEITSRKGRGTSFEFKLYRNGVRTPQ